jgi:outer membrane lipoprotein carrier protein
MTTTKKTLCALPLLIAIAACGGREGEAATAGDQPGSPTALANAPVTDVEGGGILADPEQPVSSDGTAPQAVDGVVSDPAAPAAGGGSSGVPNPGAEAPAQPATQAEQDRAAEILRRVEQAANGVRSLEADFTQSLTIPLLNQTQRGSGKLYQRKPDRFLMRFSDPAGDVMVADGRHFWLYYPSSDPRQVIRTSIAAGGEAVDLQQQFLSNPNQRFVPTLNGEETVAGRAAYVMTLVPRQRSPYKVLRIWVDKQDYLVRRFEMTEENDSVRRVELRNLRTNHTLSDALFTFTPPAGAQVFDQ